MTRSLSIKAIGWAACLSWEFLTVIMLLHLAILPTGPEYDFQLLWLRGLYPGFRQFDVTGVIIALVQGFVWPWIFSWLFVRIHNYFTRQT